MKISTSFVYVLVGLLALPVSLQAQGRGAGGPPPPLSDARAALPAPMTGLLTAAQRTAIDEMTQGVAAQTTAAANALAALRAASVAQPRNDADINAKATVLATAERDLANAKAEAFVRVQAGPNRFQAAQIPVVASGRGAARGGLTPPRSAEDAEGFVSIFDGQSLSGWDGDPTFWRAENGMIVGESTPEKVVQQNSFLIWRGGVVSDFEIKFDFRINGTNSGLQYRSQQAPAPAQWVLRGYQADLDFPNQYTGQVHDEAGRNIMAPRGQFVRAAGNGVYKFIATVGDPNEIPSTLAVAGWNQYHIIARGPVLIHVINGRVSAILIDEDAQNKDAEGLVGFQMHTGAPFRVEYKNILYRKL